MAGHCYLIPADPEGSAHGTTAKYLLLGGTKFKPQLAPYQLSDFSVLQLKALSREDWCES